MTQTWLKSKNKGVITTEDTVKLTEEELQFSLGTLSGKMKNLLEEVNELYNKHHTQELYSVITSLIENIRILKELKRTDL
jgi:hypothetical protein